MKSAALTCLCLLLLTTLAKPSTAQESIKPPKLNPMFNVARIRGEEVLLRYTEWVPGEKSFQYTVAVPYTEEVVQSYIVNVPIEGKEGKFREVTRTRTVPVTKMRHETRTGKIPVPQYSIDRQPVSAAKFFKTNGENGLTYLSTKEAKQLLSSPQPAMVLMYPDHNSPHIPELQEEPDLDPFFGAMAKKGTLVIKIKLPDPPKNPEKGEV